MLANEKYKRPGLQNSSLNHIMKDKPDGEGDEKLDVAEKNMLKYFNNPANGFTNYIYSDSLPGPVLWLINTKSTDTISFISIDSTDWVILLKSGYYWSSKNGAKQLGYTKGLNVYPFEQFDVQYNRPDLVLQAIGKISPDKISEFRQPYLTRIKLMGLDTNRFIRDLNVPEADFSNRNEIAYEQKTNKLRLDVTAQDKKFSLVRYNIWVNGVPIFGIYGKSIIEAQSRQLSTTVEITLSRGKNRIETSVTNANGAESYHLPLFVTCLVE